MVRALNAFVVIVCASACVVLCLNVFMDVVSDVLCDVVRFMFLACCVRLCVCCNQCVGAYACVICL